MESNLFRSMFEAPDDPPEVTPTDPPAVDDGPPTIDPSSTDTPFDDSPPQIDDPQFDDQSDGYQDDGTVQQQEEEDTTTLDEKGEIFAKVKTLKEYRALYSKIEDTIAMIDKIDLVQIGNNIRSQDITEIKDGLADLMQNVYTTIVYEFQMQYKNLKVKLVEYSSRYVILVKNLVTIIKKDQK